MSIPFSLANFFAKGEINILPELFKTSVLSCCASGTAAFKTAFSATGSSLFASGEKPATTPLTSVPAGPITAKIASTSADSPSLTPTYNRVPSLKDSNSIVACRFQFRLKYRLH